MNWNEWRMKWLLFWLLVAIVAILTVGCASVTDVETIDPEQYRQKPLDPVCDLADPHTDLLEESPCEAILIADIYHFDEPVNTFEQLIR